MKDYRTLQNGSDIRGVAIVDRAQAAAGLPVQMPNLTSEAAADIAAGFVCWLCEKTGKKPQELKLAIGRDPRITGATLTDGLMHGFGPYGCRVLNCGLASTPAMFMATVFPEFACDGTVMITASHLPFNRNGFKFFTREGGLNKQDIARILEVAGIGVEALIEAGSESEGDEESSASGSATDCARTGLGATDAEDDEAARGGLHAATQDLNAMGDDLNVTGGDLRWEAARILGAPVNLEGAVYRSGERIYPAEEADIMAPYSAHLRKLIVEGCRMGEKPLKGLKITVDAGNGAGGFYARQVLRPLGADISSSQYLDPDGMFLNHAPNPEDREAMASVSMRTLASQSDLGLIFDTDVDRSAAVDSRGREIARNGIVAMAAALVAETHPGTTVVTDSITSRQLTAFLEKDLGLTHLRFKRGYRNVINKAAELNAAGTDCQLAIETSGHAALKENYFLDDGAYLATKIVIRTAQLKAEGKCIESLIESLQEPADEKELRIPIRQTDFSEYGDRVLAELSQFVLSEEGQKLGLTLEEPNYEGIRINFPEGWCLLRKSLHDPILPLNMASDAAGGCADMQHIMMEFLRQYDGLELGGIA